MSPQEREAYINTACKYYWILSILNGIGYTKKAIVYNLNRFDDVMLMNVVFEMYKELKWELIKKIYSRRAKYERNRTAHKEQKTADKQFYRFLQATGYTFEDSLKNTPIRRLIKIYSIYFQDLGKLKKDLDKKDQSPYIG